MGTFNLLQSASFLDFAVDKIGSVNLNWLGKFIQLLIEGVGIIGVGVILFTLVLKTFVLPLDVYSRVKTKKQALVMERMRPQMEKLQKQYANDKQMYSQKVMELQKQNGYSMLGACLPMIVSLVIFMLVFSAFSTYSQYANLNTYNNMVDAYNASVQTYVLKDKDGNAVNENGFLIETVDISLGDKAYYVDFEKFETFYKNDAATADAPLAENFASLKESEKQVYVKNYVREHARKSAADYYRANRNNFLWVQNIWYPDSLLNKEVPNFSKFSSAVSRASSANDASYEEYYNEVTHYLRNPGYENSAGKREGKVFNGYFVLIVLAIGLMFLQQFITMKSQKSTNELGTVDGSGAKTTKWMMILMPLIYGIFSFFYSAAFSIYMITNTAFSLITTVIINKILDVCYKKYGDKFLAKKPKKGANNRKRLKR